MDKGADGEDLSFKKPNAAVMKIEGGLLLGEKTAEGFKVSRLISTDPGLFLKEELAPGAIKRL